MSKKVARAVNRAVVQCERKFDSLYEWQDCVQGVNTMSRVLRKKRVSEDTALKAAKKICAIKERYKGPRMRCQTGALTLAIELEKGRQHER